MKRIILKILSAVLSVAMLFSLISCSFLDEISKTPVQDTEETTKAPNNDNPPVAKYNRAKLKYTFLTVVEGVQEGVPALISYSVFDTANGTLSELQIPASTYINASQAQNTLGAMFKKDYSSAKSGGREAAIASACTAMMDRLKTELLFECDYYIYFDKKSMTDLTDLLGGIDVKIPFEMRFSDASVIKQGDTKLTGDNLWKVMSYGSFASGSELNMAKLLWTGIFNKLKTVVTTESISLFMLDIRANLYTSVPKTNGVDIFFLRNLLSLDAESYKFSSADVQSVVLESSAVSVICKNAFLEKMNSFLKIYDESVEANDLDKGSIFNNPSLTTVSAIYNSFNATSSVYSAGSVFSANLSIIAK